MTRAAACRLCWLGGCQSGRWEPGPARVCLPRTCELSQAAVADPEEMRGGIGIQRTWSRPPDWLLPQAPSLLGQGFRQLCSHSRPGGNSRALAPEGHLWPEDRKRQDTCPGRDKEATSPGACPGRRKVLFITCKEIGVGVT